MYYGNPKNRTIRDCQPHCCKCGKLLTTKEQLEVSYKNPRYVGWLTENNWAYNTQYDKWVYRCNECGKKQVLHIRMKTTPMRE